MNIPEAKGRSPQGMGNIAETTNFGRIKSVQSSRGGTPSNIGSVKVHFATLMDLCHLKDSNSAKDVDWTPTHKTHLCSTVCSHAPTAQLTRLAQELHCHLCVAKQVLSSGV